MQRAINWSTALLLASALTLVSAAQLRAATTLTGVVNINTATVEQLEMLPNVGAIKALAIVKHRAKHGPFRSVNDLVLISGIGDKALAQMRSFCVIEGRTTVKRE
jgi:competence protein ComEA